MIQLESKIEICTSNDILDKALLNFNQIYPKYSPNEHIRCEYIRGNLLTENSILYFEEYISGKKQEMKYKVVKIIEENNVLIIQLKALFPRSLFNIRAQFTITKMDNRILFSRTLSLGSNLFLLGSIIDKLAIFLGKKYIEEIKKHEKRDLKQLKDFIETQYN
jgi:hypothetical protein